MTSSPSCETAVDYVGGRYPFKPSCSCGWTWRGYVAEHAAAAVAAAHAAGEL